MKLRRIGIWSLPILIIVTLLGIALHTTAGMGIAAVAILIYLVAEWRRLGLMPRVLTTVAAGLAVITVITQPEPLALLARAVERYAFMASFLACLGLLRVAAEGSPLLRRCGEILIQQPPQRRYVALSMGSALFGIVINIGVLNLLGVMSQRANTLAAADGNPNIQRIRQRRMFSALLRGFALVPLVSPLGISLAVILSMQPGLHWLDIIPYAGVTALLLLVIGYALDRFGHAPPATPSEPRRQSMRPMVEFCGLLVAIVSVTFVIAELLNIQLPEAVLFSGPLAAFTWLAVQRRRLDGGTGLRRAGATLQRRADRIFPDMRSEIAILGGAGFLGVMLSALLPIETLASWLAASGLTGGWLALAATVVMLIGAQVGLNPIVTAILTLTLLPDPMVLGLPAPILATALMAGWAVSMVSAPITGSMLVSARLAGVSPRVAGWGWNGLFVALTMLVLAIWFPLLTHFAA